MTLTPEVAAAITTAAVTAAVGYLYSSAVSALNEYLRRKQAAGEPKNPFLLNIAAALNASAGNLDKANTQRKAAAAGAPMALPFVPFTSKHLGNCVDPNCDQTCIARAAVVEEKAP